MLIMDMQNLVGKIIKNVEEKCSGDVVDITFTDNTLLRFKSFGFGDGMLYEINPEEEAKEEK